MTRRKVAVFSANIYEPMTHAITEGISKAALELGIKLIYFASFSDSFSNKIYEQYSDYDKGDIVSFELADLDDFDGVVRIDLTYGPYTLKHLDDRLAGVDIPVVNVGGFDERYCSIVNNENLSFENIVEHLITVHGCKDIYHVAGLKERIFTQTRIDAYKSALQKHNIPYDPDKVYYGTLWHDCGEAALEYILEDCKKHGKKYPDAVVCANDYSAVGFVDACHNHGIDIPRDLLVTGYDGLEEAEQGYPSITTGAQPFAQSGYEGIYKLYNHWTKNEPLEHKLILGELRCNQSCGCKPMNSYNVDDIRSIYTHRLDRVSEMAQSTTNLILSVSSANTMEECFNEITENAAIDSGFDDMLLCLAPGWETQRILPPDFAKMDEEMRVVAGFIGDTPVRHQTFRKKDLLPPDLLADPKPYYIFAIHHLQYYMGYLIVTPQNNGHESLFMKSWIVNLGSMLENWRIRQKLNLAVQRMESLYNRDMLTNLYNRHGYEMYFAEFFKECREKQVPIGVLMIDMDDLKLINDNYGHTEGDYSICTIADGMRFAATRGEIGLRTGGDEFVVLAKDYSDAKALEYARVLRDYIETCVSRDKKDYEVSVSVGSCIMLPPESDLPKVEEGETIDEALIRADEAAIQHFSEEYLKIADAAMYKEKSLHKKGRS